MNNDFDIDDILNREDLFQPLTDGLGFHHSIQDKSKVSASLKRKSTDLQKDLRKRALELSIRLPLEEKAFDMGELSPFYNLPDRVDAGSVTSLSLNGEYANEYVESSLIKRFIAFTVDMTLILTLLFTSLILSSLILNLTLDNLYKLDSVSIFILTTMSSLFYLLYFSFFDKSEYSSVGKRTVGIKLISIRGDVTFSQVLLRSALSLISLASLGMLSILKLESKLTETLIIENE